MASSISIVTQKFLFFELNPLVTNLNVTEQNKLLQT